MVRQKKTLDSGTPEFLESRLFKIGTRMFLGLLVIVAFLTLIQCTVKSPQAPQWTTELVVPLINRTYQMDELVQRIDQNAVQLQGNDVVFSITQEIDTLGLNGGQLTTPDLTYSLGQQLGPIAIDPPTVAPVTVDVASIGPLAAVIPGDVPPVSFTVVNDIPPITSFTSADIVSGTIYLVITNNLGVDLDIVSVTLRDQLQGIVIDTGSVPGGIATGSVGMVPLSLDNKTITNELEVTIAAHTNGGTVLSSSGKDISTDVQFAGQFTVATATAEIPATSRVYSQIVSLNEPNAVYAAVLDSGQLELSITNNTSLDANLTVTFADIVQFGQPLVVQQSIAANSSAYSAIDISGYEIRPADSTVPQQLAINIQADLPGTSPNQVPVDSADGFSVSAALRGLSFASVTGVFDTTDVTIAPTMQPVDIPTGFDSVQLVSAVLTLQIENAISLPGSLYVQITGDNGRSLTLSGPIAPGSRLLPVTTTFVDSNVAAFLNPIPSNVTLSGSVRYSGGGSVQTISADDYILPKVTITSPLELVLGPTTVETDIERTSIDQGNISAITDHVQEARFVYNIINHLPIGALVNIYFGPDSATLLTNPQLLIDSLTVVAAPTSGGIVTDTASSGFRSITLTNTDIRVLENDTLFTAVELLLEGSGGQVIRLTGNDYVTVQGRMEVDYRFDGNF